MKKNYRLYLYSTFTDIYFYKFIDYVNTPNLPNTPQIECYQYNCVEWEKPREIYLQGYILNLLVHYSEPRNRRNRMILETPQHNTPRNLRNRIHLNLCNRIYKETSVIG